MKTVGIRLLLTVFLMVLLELIVINVAGILPFIAANKANVSGAPYMDFLFENLLVYSLCHRTWADYED